MLTIGAPVRDGNVTVVVPGGALRDYAGNSNAASNTVWFVIDRQPPTAGVLCCSGAPEVRDATLCELAHTVPRRVYR